jgi:putative flippase GtrA
MTEKIKGLVRYFYAIRFVRYLAVGGSTFFIDLSVLFLLHGVMKIHLAIAASISFWLSILFNFYANRIWVFSARDKRKLHEHAVLYGILLGVNYLYTIVAISLLTRFMGYGVAKILILVIQIAWTFPIYKYIIFQSHKNPVIKKDNDE